MINRKARTKDASFSIFVRLYDKCMTKQNENRVADICNAVSVRSEADSNRCTRFCRPLPSHSAIRPMNSIPMYRTTQTQPFHCPVPAIRNPLESGRKPPQNPCFPSLRPPGLLGVRDKIGTSGVQIYKLFPILQNLQETLRDFFVPHPLFGKI